MRTWMRRMSGVLLMMASGGMFLQVNSCNPNVREAIVTGLETTSLSIANTLIRALFEGLDGEAATSLAAGVAP